MAELVVPVKVSKEFYELLQGCVKFVAEMKKAVGDGWQVGDDVPVMARAVLEDLVPAMQGVSQVAGELAQNPEAFMSAGALGAVQMLAVFK